MINIELDEEMDAPCPCQKCGNWFDQSDGTTSRKWYPNTIICESCGKEEEQEIETDEEIEELKTMIADAEWTIKDSNKRLKELGVLSASTPPVKEQWVCECENKTNGFTLVAGYSYCNTCGKRC